ncbi:MAG: hypothetical protein JWP29_2001 [Rhodoferax sp.]|nr:hypothetical protein [Rhodoferax sp.]
MKLSNFIEGLTILRKRFKGEDGFHIGAEHDEFFVYATDEPLSPEEVTKLQELGWSQSEVEDGAPYDPAEGWHTFV